jgi:hypothetical protein
MISFEWELDTVDGKEIWFLGCTSVKGEDAENTNAIYEQLDANSVGWGLGV